MALKLKLRRDTSAKVTNTGYTASGHQAPEKASYNELGSQLKSVLPDPVPALANPTVAARTYLSMYRSDVSVRVSLRCAEGPVLGGDYNIEPYDEEPINLAIREFVEFNLFGAQTTPWLSTVSQILKMFRYGWQPFEPVWELREWAPSKTSPGANRKQYTTLRKLAVRPPETITHIEYDDNGGPFSINQIAIGKDNVTREVTIPISKLVIFTFEKDGGDITGNSVLRTAYRHWFMKDKFYAIDGVQKERHGIGVPRIELQPGFSEQDRLMAHTLGRNLRTNEFSYMVTTPFLKVDFAELSGNPVNALESAMHHDLMIMKNILVQFLNQSEQGGRATSATSMDMMMKSMRYVANYICDVINQYVIPQIVSYNFNTDQYPKLTVRNVGEAKDLQMWAAAMANLINAEAIVVDEDTENWIRRQVDAPKRTTPRPAPVYGPHDVRQQTLIQEGGASGNQPPPPGANAPTTTNNGAGGKQKGAVTDAIKSGNVGVSPSSSS